MPRPLIREMIWIWAVRVQWDGDTRAITVSFRLAKGFGNKSPSSLIIPSTMELMGGASLCYYHYDHYDYYLLSAVSVQLRSPAWQLARQLAALAVRGGGGERRWPTDDSLSLTGWRMLKQATQLLLLFFNGNIFFYMTFDWGRRSNRSCFSVAVLSGRQEVVWICTMQHVFLTVNLTSEAVAEGVVGGDGSAGVWRWLEDGSVKWWLWLCIDRTNYRWINLPFSPNA